MCQGELQRGVVKLALSTAAGDKLEVGSHMEVATCSAWVGGRFQGCSKGSQ